MKASGCLNCTKDTFIALFHVLGMRQAGRMGHLLNVSVPFFTFYGKDTDKSMIILGVFSGIY